MDLTIRKDTLSPADQSWLGSDHGTTAAEPVTLDKSAFTLATHYPSGFFKSGIPLGKITASGKYGPYDNAAVDGRETLVGLLLDAPSAPSDDVDPQGAMVRHCIVVESKLPIAIDAPGKTDVAGRIIFR